MITTPPNKDIGASSVPISQAAETVATNISVMVSSAAVGAGIRRAPQICPSMEGNKTAAPKTAASGTVFIRSTGSRKLGYRQYKPPITTKPPHQNTYNHDSLTVRRLPTTAHLLFDAPAATHQPTPSHIWHLINLHRAAIALAGSPYPPLPCVVPIDHPWPSAPSRAPVPASLPSKPLAAVRVLHRATSR